MSAATYRGDLTRCGRCQHKKPADGWRLCAACKELHKVYREAKRLEKAVA